MYIPGERDARPAVPIRANRVLLVEGDTPAHFFEAFLRNLGLSKKVEVRVFGGIAELPSYLRVLVRTEGFRRKVTSLAIVRDAEEDANAARSSLKDAIAKAGILEHVRVATYVLPDNHGPGMLETLCMRAVADDESFDCVAGFFRCLSSKGIPLIEGFRRDKHLAQVFLATKPEAQMFPGIAAYRGFWPFDNDVFDGVRAFLTSL